MYTVGQAKKIVYDYVNRPKKYNYPDQPNYELIVDLAEEKPYGWIFDYQTKKFVETKDIRFAAIGTSPIIFEKETGRLVLLSSARHPEYYIELYEKGEWNCYADE